MTQGDSGGALVYSGVQIGIVSWGARRCAISRSVYAGIRRTAVDNRTGERVAELIFPLSSERFFRDRGGRQCIVEKIFASV